MTQPLSDFLQDVARRNQRIIDAMAGMSEAERRRRLGERPLDDVVGPPPIAWSPPKVAGAPPCQKAAPIDAEAPLAPIAKGPALMDRIGVAHVHGQGRRSRDISPNAARAIESLLEEMWGRDRAKTALPWTTNDIQLGRAAVVGLAGEVIGAQNAAISRWTGIPQDSVARARVRHHHLLVTDRGYRAWFVAADNALRQWLNARGM